MATQYRESPTSVLHLMNFEWLNTPLAVYHHEDAIYFDRDQITKTMPTSTKKQLFASRSVSYAETGIVYGTTDQQTPPWRFKMLGEAAIKELTVTLHSDLYNSIVGTIIPYALRFIIRRDIRVMRTDMKLMNRKIAFLMTICDARVTAVDNADDVEYLAGQLVNIGK